MDAPHFAYPFRVTARGVVVTNEQDSPEDVADCVQAVLLTRPGDRPEHPDFGVPDLTFSQRPLPVDDVADAVNVWEPRARALAAEDPDTLADAVARVRLTLGGANA